MHSAVSSDDKMYSLPVGFNPPELSLPPKQVAIIQAEGGKATICNDTDLPVPEPHMVFVKIAAVSINPCDWKMPSKFPSPGARIGCDYVGTVLSIGPDAAKIQPHLKVGDRVCGGVHGSNPIDHPSGSFAQYVVGHADLLLRLPGSISWAEGAVLGGSGIATLRLALYESLQLVGTPDRPLTGNDIPHVLVYGGSTSTGTLALQILRLSGYKPITTCSPRSNALVEAYGAAMCFDYHSPTCAEEIKTYTKGKLNLVLDIITDGLSQQICYGAFGRLGGRYCCLELPSEALHTRKTIKKEMIVGLAASGKRIALADGYEREANPCLRGYAADFFRIIQQQLDQGRFKAHPPRVLTGDFNAILEGLVILKDKGTSCEKLVAFVDRDLEC